MKKTRIFFILTLLVAGAVAEAQQIPTGKWWRREEVVRQLALTSDQQTRLDEVFRALTTHDAARAREGRA